MPKTSATPTSRSALTSGTLSHSLNGEDSEGLATVSRAVDVGTETGSAPLMDRHGRRHTYLRVSITDRCNLRCRYCMPAEGIEWTPRDQLLSFEEIQRVVAALAEVGVNKVRITGGEPTVRRGVETLIESVAGTPGITEVCMTTNGTTLGKMAGRYRSAGLDVLNISLDSLRADRFEEITRTKKFDQVLRGIDAALEAGFAPIKLNVVAMRGVNEDEVCDFVEFVRDRPINVRFIEFMPFEGNSWSRAKFLPYQEMISDLERRYKLTPLPERPNQVARDFSIEGCEGTISFITSMSENFCAGCNRIRLTAQGDIKACLFMTPGARLRERLRSGADSEEIVEVVRGAILQKWPGHPGAENLLSLKNASMIQIGG
ncbi:MAG: GTP 3',8-cyclase MoaA [Armatimonadetes bacterium]|nr:GTP 3',8-cyclase MoaA [Armatimonadota bacterium]